MIEVRWEILEEESRAIKVMVDMAKIPCKLLEKNQKSGYEDSQQKQNVIESIEDLKNLAPNYKNIQSFFGKTKEQQKQVANLLQIYYKTLKSKLQVPIISYYKLHKPPLPKDLLQNKLTQILQAMKIIDSMIANKTSKFICGDSITVVDLVFYFNICNMVYFKRNHSDYPNTAEWFGNVYKIREVRAITHQWFSMAKQITKNIGKVEISPHL